jgi:hypothetical protein
VADAPGKNATKMRKNAWAGTTQGAFVESETQEHRTLLRAVRVYSKVVAFFMMVSLCVVLEEMTPYFSTACSSSTSPFEEQVNDGIG